MHISLSPAVMSGELSLEMTGDTLTINGDELDLSVIAEGADIPDELARELHPMIAGPIFRQDGEIHITLILPLPADCADPWMCFPEPLDVTHDGPVDVPWPSYSEVTEAPAPGGRNIITTTYRWRQPLQVETVFVADPPAPEPEPEMEDAE